MRQIALFFVDIFVNPGRAYFGGSIPKLFSARSSVAMHSQRRLSLCHTRSTEAKYIAVVRLGLSHRVVTLFLFLQWLFTGAKLLLVVASAIPSKTSPLTSPDNDSGKRTTHQNGELKISVLVGLSANVYLFIGSLSTERGDSNVRSTRHEVLPSPKQLSFRGQQNTGNHNEQLWGLVENLRNIVVCRQDGRQFGSTKIIAVENGLIEHQHLANNVCAEHCTLNRGGRPTVKRDCGVWELTWPDDHESRSGASVKFELWDMGRWHLICDD
ncbi:hypothetical protein AB1N83_001879 [Pleurotus pulmonarius]